MMLVVGGILAALVVLGQCTKADQTGQALADKPMWEGAEQAGSSDFPEVADASLSLAKVHAQRALGALSEEGAKVYSENCRALLNTRFSIEAFDRCYAFDLLAGRMLQESGDAGYFSDFSPSSIESSWSTSFPGQDPDLLSERRKRIAADIADMVVVPEAPPRTISEDPVSSEASEIGEGIDDSLGEAVPEQDDETLDVDEMSG